MKMQSKTIGAISCLALIFLVIFAGCINDGVPTTVQGPRGTGTHGAATTITNGATITHGLGTTPTGCQVQPSVANTTMSVTALGATTITVSSWRTNATNGAGAAGATGISQTVYWECWV